MLPTEAAYLAGLIDGEGTISLRKVPQPKCKRGWNWRPTLQVANTDEAMLHRISEITERGWEWCYHYYQGRKLRAGIWRTTGANDILCILSEVLPYLVTKKRHADLLIEACKLILSLPKGKNIQGYESRFLSICPRLFSIHEKMLTLNKRGERWRRAIDIGYKLEI